jgi:hypothetical protein
MGPRNLQGEEPMGQPKGVTPTDLLYSATRPSRRRGWVGKERCKDRSGEVAVYDVVIKQQEARV